MKPLLISFYDNYGGAAKSAYRLHKGLRLLGIDSQMLVQTKITDDQTVLASHTKLLKGLAMLRPTLDQLPLKLYPSRQKNVYFAQWLPEQMESRISQLDTDIINLHWICGGLLQIETLAKINKPIVWTLHDMWALTGGCHYSFDCNRFTDSCGACPQLGSQHEHDLSHWVWHRKYKAWKNINLTFVTPSHWLAKCVSSSSLFKNSRVEVIPYGLNIKTYKPILKKLSREFLNLPLDKKLILFGSFKADNDKRKGFHLLQQSLQNLRQLFSLSQQIELVILGSSEPRNPPDLGFKTHYLGCLHDDIAIAHAYSAVDVFVAPSLQDNLPNTVMEALACGTPCVAFNIGGMPDMIEHEQNGYLVQPFEVDDLAKGIAWILTDEERWQQLSVKARMKIEKEFTQELQANRYLSLFQEIQKNNDSNNPKYS